MFEAPIPFSVTFTGDDVDPAAVVAAAEAVLAAQSTEARTASVRRGDDRLDLPDAAMDRHPRSRRTPGRGDAAPPRAEHRTRSNGGLSRPPESCRPTSASSTRRTSTAIRIPGEVVWAWVPFEDDPTLGKDRPVVIIGRHGDVAVRCRPDVQGRATAGSTSAPGTGTRKHRRSYAKVDRLLDIDPHAVRREGSILNRRQFDQVVDAVVRIHTVVR